MTLPFNMAKWMDKVDLRLHRLENRRPKEEPAGGEIPWFVCTGVWTGESSQFSPEVFTEGSFASAGGGGIFTTLNGYWQITYGWVLSGGSGTVYFKANPPYQLFREVPADPGDPGFSSNQITAVLTCGPGHSAYAEVGSAWVGNGWAAGHYIGPWDPPNET